MLSLCVHAEMAGLGGFQAMVKALNDGGLFFRLRHAWSSGSHMHYREVAFNFSFLFFWMKVFTAK